ncbi:RsmB/NOP family class I SAM-dependent RNA methyltransferase [Spirochaeta lutea]|uniref:hypothetical protein n=1 Tax=Spirochaeta lutea TaxID=1480694 RepID=UPI000689214F|nr:hypothetical protein [Spirochaeta lutea]
MAKQSKTLRGIEGFKQYYTTIFQDRWPGLLSALESEHQYCALRALSPDCSPYYLDLASALPPLLLNIEPGHQVLDLCAAPGGKTLVILRRLFPDFFTHPDFEELTSVLQALSPFTSPSGISPGSQTALLNPGRLVANERSASRRARLHNNLANHTTPALNQYISVTGHDATKWGLYEQNRYHRVLVDVPCSSERHLVENPKHLQNWSPNRTKQLSIQGGAMVLGGFDALMPGGILVYSTCALSPLENDAVVQKLLKKRPASRLLSLDETQLPPWMEPTQTGYHILPDRSSGLGPIFLSGLTKEESLHD